VAAHFARYLAGGGGGGGGDSPIAVVAIPLVPSRCHCPCSFPLVLALAGSRSCRLALTCTRSCWSSSGPPSFVRAAPALVHAAVPARCRRSLLLAVVLAGSPTPALVLAGPRLARPRSFVQRPLSFMLPSLVQRPRSCRVALTCARSCWSSSGPSSFVRAAPALVRAALVLVGALPALACQCLPSYYSQPLVYVCIKYIVSTNNIIILLTFIQWIIDLDKSY
jgi:hypothetical protein